MVNQQKHIFVEIFLLAIIFLLVFFQFNTSKNNFHDTDFVTATALSTLTPQPTVLAQPIETVSALYCVTPFDDWRQVTYSTIDAVLSNKIDFDLVLTSASYLTKAKVLYEGFDYSNNSLARNFYGHAFFNFSENGNQYKLPVSKHIENSLLTLKENTEITTFITAYGGSAISPSENLVVDFAVGEASANEPDLHWSIEIIQNGNIYSQDDVIIENRPFTVRANLPRFSKDTPEILMNVQYMDAQTPSSTNHNADCKSYPFACGNTIARIPYNGSRSFPIDSGVAALLSFDDCFHHGLNMVKFLNNEITYEVDVLYFDVWQDVLCGIHTCKDIFTQPISAFAKRKLQFSFFLDNNHNKTIDSNELQKIFLTFSDVP
jgi:hypothetical protein